MSDEHPSIAIIGGGNMGSALAGGLLANDHPAEKLYLSDPSAEKRKILETKYGLKASADNESAVQAAEVVIFATKPQVLGPIAQSLATLIQDNKALVISIAAGIPLTSLETWLGKEVPIVRCMPNTPALIGCGVSALFANEATEVEQRLSAENILGCVGSTLWLDNEKQMDAVTALSGSGPAYFFLLMEALQETGCQLGLTKEMSETLTLQTAYGAALLALESGETISDLRHQVTSPGGTTEAALQIFEQANFKKIVAMALQAAQKRSQELALLLGTTETANDRPLN